MEHVLIIHLYTCNGTGDHQGARKSTSNGTTVGSQELHVDLGGSV